MRFEWDHQKAALNARKHGATFAEARTVFRDPLARVFDDEAHSAQEKREIIIGRSILNRLAIVCFAERTGVIRLFNARLATPSEREDYEENTTL